MSLSQALNQFAQNLGRYRQKESHTQCGWELAFTLLDKLAVQHQQQ